MIFTSLKFAVFFIAVLLIYFIFPAKWRYLWLLAASYIFYAAFSVKYLFILFFSTIITYGTGIFLDKGKSLSIFPKKVLLSLGIILDLLPLLYSKYINFTIGNINSIKRMIGLKTMIPTRSIILPIGISFFTFVSLSYIIDIYRNKIKPEKNLAKYALFISFFPCISSGPIERANSLLVQINELDRKKVFNSHNILSGGSKFLCGLFIKLVLTDRISIFCDEVFSNYSLYGSTFLIIGSILFGIQVYGDFYSYSTMALGCAQILGIDVTDNFNAPYLTYSISDYWRNWHISLMNWFRDYIYIPLGGNRCSKQRKYLNIMITFLVSGFWHGAGWHFIVWGGIHGFYQIIEAELKPVLQKICRKTNAKVNSFSYKLMKIVVNNILIDLAFIFFKVTKLRYAFVYIKRLFSCPDPWNVLNGSIYELGIDRAGWKIVWLSLAFLLLLDLLKKCRKMYLYEWLETQCVWFRWLFYIGIILSIFVFGIYGPEFNPSSFIYFTF